MTRGGPGFSIHEGVFGRAAMQAALESLGRSGLPRTRAGVRHVLAVPAVRALAGDPALVEIAREYVGPRAL